MMPYAVDELGRPVFFISSMAMHTHNLKQDARASLLITQPDAAGDPLGAARVTLVGTASEAPAPEVRELYLCAMRTRATGRSIRTSPITASTSRASTSSAGSV